MSQSPPGDSSTIPSRLRTWARSIKRDVIALMLAASEPRVPWYAKVVAAVVAAYALSPIDLIPDFIPVIGYLDDLLLVPLGILLAVKLIPPPVMAELRAAAESYKVKPKSLAGAAIVLTLWAVAVYFIARALSQPA